MLPEIMNKFKTLALISVLLTVTFPITPAKSQTPNTLSQQRLQTNTSKPKLLTNQPEKLSQTNLLAEDTKPSVVRVALGCKAKVYSPINGKIYEPHSKL